ncbi:MAG TPA: ATP-binding protein [Acidimicrobiales bacterium]|jgi:anti-sigma regulatory factor (Ser/Thr protein kinase)|nr:ATP-binding protein [Acidimicrobiales bacterium]
MFELLAEREYPAAIHAPRNARRLVTEALDGVDPDTVEMAVLVTSELTTNAVTHAAGPFGLKILRDDKVVRIEVSDSSPSLPTVQPTSVLRGGGRGLSIVEQIAERWGVVTESARPGKTVWCEIAIGP